MPGTGPCLGLHIVPRHTNKPGSKYDDSTARSRTSPVTVSMTHPIPYADVWPRFIQEPSKLTDKSKTSSSASLAASLVVD